ncbi:MAG: hydroxyethylthiazole kinase [Bdellovibrionaceae bacterium]|nr:hydroxyethylthiazole kinase [Pseudobdellovibrionaceae bacterium]
MSCASAKKFGCIVVLKGHKTLIAEKKSVWEIQSGSSALAKAGTGDVLTGIIAGFLRQRMSSLKASNLAVHVHGLTSDYWIKAHNDPLSFMASDLIEGLPKILYEIRE